MMTFACLLFHLLIMLWPVVGKINHFIFKALISGKKWKSRWHLKTIDLLNLTTCLGNEWSIEIKGSNYSTMRPIFASKKNQRSKVKRWVHRSCPLLVMAFLCSSQLTYLLFTNQKLITRWRESSILFQLPLFDDKMVRLVYLVIGSDDLVILCRDV
jgi:hypothetical protein